MIKKSRGLVGPGDSIPACTSLTDSNPQNSDLSKARPPAALFDDTGEDPPGSFPADKACHPSLRFGIKLAMQYCLTMKRRERK
ncbi:hypothetical protein DCMF_21005 [Candidatus Formimonas warabiya]|uniref:Uncharacterized protein n=1 Tax=Formimonas warabiya TaxID=1761012 RepID=A0A3G1KWN6_FORW1|nr:hypothetical protein DCMF_21005 [Candidatus Formimonas warabiya]